MSAKEVYDCLYNQLHSFDSYSASGIKLNHARRLICGDREFESAVERLLRQLVARQTNGRTIAFDGMDLISMEIQEANTVTINLLLSYLDSPFGFAQFPAQIVATILRNGAGTSSIEIRCGVSEADGDFWFRNMKTANFSFPENYVWAYNETKHIGSNSLQYWRRSRGTTR